ncbi:MAG: TIGR03905 family TSCPD domain-containing protein [Bacteroidales bacterium]|nr:TIGR03905 family TSCPD domain-containing protein [Bacteroidales bacterium]
MPEGVCSQIVEVWSRDHRIERIQFTGGCHGNTQGVARLAEGRTFDEVISLLRGIDCGGKGTSCPDQLAEILEAVSV